MIKTSDYIAQRLRDFYGIKDVFLITGGRRDAFKQRNRHENPVHI